MKLANARLLLGRADRLSRGRADEVGQGGTEGGLDEFGLLALVDGVGAGGGAGAGVSADVFEILAGQLAEAAIDEGPAPHVLRLFLRPDEFARVAVSPQRGGEGLG